MSIGRRAVLAGMAAGLATSARAQTSPMAEAFAGWMARNQVANGVLALSLSGRLVLLEGFGGRDPAQRQPVWSLSKFVTGLAVARLAAQGRLALDMPLARVMPRRLARHGVDASPIAQVTIGQLLTHRSGLPRSPGGEEVPGLRAALRFRPPQGLATEDLAPALFAAVPARSPGEAYEYSNSNFLLAGFAVEEAAGEPYAAFVAREVMGRVGIRRAALDGIWGLLGATGGWSLSAPEYLGLMLRGLQGETLVPPAVRRWMEDPQGKAISAGGSAFYSLGLLGRPVEGGLNRWHAGTWRFRWPAWQMDENSGTLAVLAADRAAWFAAFAPHPGDAAVAELDRVLWAGRRAVAAAPPSDRFDAFLDPLR